MELCGIKNTFAHLQHRSRVSADYGGYQETFGFKEDISSRNLSILSAIFTPNIPQPVTIGRVTACPLPKGGLIRNWLRFFLGILDKGALQGILKPACLFFPGNNACNNTRKGTEKKYYFAEGAELCYKRQTKIWGRWLGDIRNLMISQPTPFNPMYYQGKSLA